MLQDLRAKSQSIFIYLIFAVIILSFVFTFGVPTDACSPTQRVTVAEVSGEPITDDKLNSALRRVYALSNRNLPSDTTKPEFKQAQRQVLDNMILVYTIADVAEEAGMAVSEEELATYIADWEQGNPDAFLYINSSTEYRFKKESYESTLNYYGISKKDYEAYKERELLARNYLTMLHNSVVVSDAEVDRMLAEQRMRYELDYIKLEPQHVAHLITEPTDAEIDAFLAEKTDELEAYKAENSERFAPRLTFQEIIVQRNDDMLKDSNKGSETDASLPAAKRFAVVKKAVLEDKMDFAEASAKYNETYITSHKPDSTGEVRGETKALENISSAERKKALESMKPGEVAPFETKIHYGLIKLIKREETTDREIAAELIKSRRDSEKLDAITAELKKKLDEGVELEAALDAVLYADVKDEAVQVNEPMPPPPAPATVAAPPADAETTESGLASKVLSPGTGTEKPSATDEVTVHYTGWTTDGEMFDSSVTRGKPSTFGLDAVIAGWTEGLQLMTVGEKRRFWIPEALAYKGQPGKPAGMLVFDVELIEIVDPEPAVIRTSVQKTGPFNPMSDGAPDPRLLQMAQDPNVPPELKQQLIQQLMAQSGSAWNQIKTDALTRDLLEVTEPGLLDTVYSLEGEVDGRLIANVTSVDEAPVEGEEDPEAIRERLREQLRLVRSQALLGQWRAILALQHPSPEDQAYGAWIARVYEQAKNKGAFAVSTEYFRPAEISPAP